MEKEVLRKLTFIPIKILAILTAIIILTKFSYVFYDFIKNPFPDPTFIPKEAVRHVMTALILLELLALTLHFLIEEVINPNIIIITVLTVLGRDIIVLDLQEIDYRNLFAISLLFAITIVGLYFLKFEKS
jgi:uncharacterized membrane protein (DUF373 family)